MGILPPLCGIRSRDESAGTKKINKINEADVQIQAEMEGVYCFPPSLKFTLLVFSEPCLHPCSSFHCNTITSVY